MSIESVTSLGIARTRMVDEGASTVDACSTRARAAICAPMRASLRGSKFPAETQAKLIAALDAFESGRETTSDLQQRIAAILIRVILPASPIFVA